MTRNLKYFLSQILAVPFVILPGMVAAFVVVNWIGAHMSLKSNILFGIAGCVAGGSISWFCGKFFGRVLICLGMLPVGAERKYPVGRSWRDYETKPTHGM
jgi:hypothetical protein